MRKYIVFLPAFGLLTGVLGFLLRRHELNTIFDAETGLAQRWALITIAIVALLVLALVAISLISRKITALYDEPSNYIDAFASHSRAELVVSLVAAALIAIGAVMNYLERRSGGAQLNLGDFAFLVFAGASAVSVLFLAANRYRANSGMASCIFSVIPALFACYWMVIIYRDNGTNPVILDFYLQCVAMAFVSLAYYYEAGYVYGRKKPIMTIVTHFMAIALLLIVLADSVQFSWVVMIIAIIVNLSVNMMRFVLSFVPKRSGKLNWRNRT